MSGAWESWEEHLIRSTSAICFWQKMPIPPLGWTRFCSFPAAVQSGILDPDTRLRMTSLAVADNPHFQVSDIEIRRSGYTYTCETLEQLEKENPDTEFFFLAGADSLFAMETWKDPEIIFQKATVLAAVRDDCGNSRLSEQAERLRKKYHGRICLIPSGNVEISSSDIRSRIQEGRSIRYLVPERVREYIEENGLYRQAAGKAGEEIST